MLSVDLLSVCPFNKFRMSGLGNAGFALLSVDLLAAILQQVQDERICRFRLPLQQVQGERIGMRLQFRAAAAQFGRRVGSQMDPNSPAAAIPQGLQVPGGLGIG